LKKFWPFFSFEEKRTHKNQNFFKKEKCILFPPVEETFEQEETKKKNKKFTLSFFVSLKQKKNKVFYVNKEKTNFRKLPTCFSYTRKQSFMRHFA
jgi:hypothetical protein